MATTRNEEAPTALLDGRASTVPRLSWASKPATVERVALPCQVVETINESRATREADRGSLFAGSGNGQAGTGWRNKLIWGDNKLVAASLLEDFAGQVGLVYIDPPFDTGTDFSFRVKVGDEQVTKQPSILEAHAYSDTWGAGRASYMRMMYERIVLIWELLSDGGSFYLHCAPNVSHYLKVVCDEVFGVDAFVNEIVWKRQTAHSDVSQGAEHLGRLHDVLFLYLKGQRAAWNMQFTPYDEKYVAAKYPYTEDETGRRYGLWDMTGPGGEAKGNPRYEVMGVTRYWRFSQERMAALLEEGRVVQPSDGAVPRYKRYLDEMPGVPLQDIWTDVSAINSQAGERVGYPTQKPLSLMERIIKLSSNEGDLVADLFCGSGTTAVAAERLGRRWIAADLGRFAIHTTRKRLLDTHDCSPFEILNLGSYERQHWQQGVAGGEIDAYVNFILNLYDAEPVDGYRLLHGKKTNRLIHVGAVDAPVTIDEVDEVMDELAANDLRSADVLGWEWEMGFHDVVTERARRRGLDLACRQIPREVMSAELDDEVRFFELAYLDLEVDRQGRSVRVQLRDFVIPSEELIPESVRSKISQWSDYIDYWAVDFNFRDDTFHNEWQTYRTRDEPKLATESDWHDYETPGGYAIVIKVIDIFGNDTTKLAEVEIK
jgi:adenine-specific DNA-methyltransferase